MNSLPPDSPGVRAYAGLPDAASDLNLQIGGNPPADWDDLLRSDPDADFFHTSSWTGAVSRCYREKTSLWLTVRLGDRLAAGMAVVHTDGRWVDLLESSIQGTSGGPLIARDLPVDLAGSLFLLLVDHFHQLRSGLLGSLSLSLNPGHESRFGNLLADDSRWVRHDHPTAVVSLEGGFDAVQGGRRKMTKRKERNRAEKRGVAVTISQDPALLAEYYPIYERACGNWGIEPTPVSLLQDLLSGPSDEPEQVGDQAGEAFFTCVTLEGTVIGGHLNLCYGDRVVAWNGVTDPRYGRRYFPATAAIWADLEESCRRGARWLDLGGSGNDTKLEEFKSHFGACEQVRGWYTSDTFALRVLRAGRDRWRRSKAGRLPDKTVGES
jgi:Acetyltransferase (GNAT) domain